MEHQVTPQRIEIQALCILRLAEFLGSPPPTVKAPQITELDHTCGSLSFFKAAAQVFSPGNSEHTGNVLSPVFATDTVAGGKSLCLCLCLCLPSSPLSRRSHFQFLFISRSLSLNLEDSTNRRSRLSGKPWLTLASHDTLE